MLRTITPDPPNVEPESLLGSHRPAVQRRVVAGAAAALALFSVLIGLGAGGRETVLLVIGAALGLALYHATFGFTTAYRQLLLSGRSVGVRAQLVMLGLASAAFAPLLSHGETFGQPLRGALAPIDLPLLVGAFLFGIGMQLAGGCASGTLYTVGGGSTRMLIVLATFVAGSYVGTWHLVWWREQPTLGTVSLYHEEGWFGGFLIQLSALVLFYWIVRWIEARRRGSVEPILGIGAPVVAERLSRLLRGPWPLLWGATALALLNTATLVIAGRPWAVTSAFALWGAKLARLAGDDPTRFEYWRWPTPDAALRVGLEHDTTSVMNLGLILGALGAAGLAGRFAPSTRLALRPTIAALGGGLLLGYGARLSYGCNIGAFFSGVASGSLHGWVWLIAALAGTLLAIPVRPLCGLSNELGAPPRQ